MKLQHTLIAAAAALASVGASASTIVLDFENISRVYPHSNSTVFVQNYYNGGTSSDGTSGTNYGVEIGGNGLVICLNSTSVFCSNTSRGGLAPNSAQGGLFFLSGNQTYMNVAAGFDTGFSFNYVSLSFSGSVNVYDGLNGTGNLLASVGLTPNAGSCPGYGAQFCPFGAAGVAFNGIAKSVSFGGVANQIVFDDITFGAVTPGVPEPQTYALMALGLAGIGFMARRRQRQA
ncbi:MAG: PEP-CTERM sorting domain-containing protein [Aquabacterium sp.]